jgi:hypothetical protein
MEKYQFKNKPKVAFKDEQIGAKMDHAAGASYSAGCGQPPGNISGLADITSGQCDFPTVSEATECTAFGIDFTITRGCIR